MQKLNLDVTLAIGESSVKRVVTVKQYDSHIDLWFRLTAGGRPYRLTEDCLGVFTAKKPDGTVVFNHCSRVGNAFLYRITPQTTAVAGELPCELKLYGPGEELLTSAAFILRVVDTVYTGQEVIASATEAEALTRLIDETRQNLSQMEEVLQAADELVRVDDTEVGDNAWSAKKLVETFCPPLEQTGSLVSGQLLQGAPLQLGTRAGAQVTELELTVCGRNLFDFMAEPYKIQYGKTEDTQRIGFALHLPAGTYTIHPEGTSAAHYIYGGIYTANGDFKEKCYLVVREKMETHTFTLEEGDVLYIYNGNRNLDIPTAKALFAQFPIQLEAGTVATDYTPFRGQTWRVALGDCPAEFGNGACYDWNTGLLESDVGEWWQQDPQTGEFVPVPDPDTHIPPVLREFCSPAGECWIYSNTGTVTVRGRQDPVALLQKLTEAV